MTWMRLARGIGVLTVVIGVIHIAVAEMEYDAFSFDALWFVGSGLGVILIGALTCLASSTRAWPALRLTAVMSNVAGVLLGLCFSSMSEWQQPQGPTLVALFTLGTVSAAMLQLRPVART
jgi:peptidoglycan/LPS O-acetylase OafA/YrhL